MVYPSDGDPIVAQALENLRADMEAIATSGTYHHDVTRAFVYEGRQIQIVNQPTVIIVVPGTDEISGHLSCQRTEHLFTVSLIGTIRRMPNSEDWKTQAQWLLADMEYAISQDMQLGGTVVYIEPTSRDVFDAGDDTVAVCQLTTSINYRHAYDNPSVSA